MTLDPQRARSPSAFHLLSERTGSAAENMATDFLLLQRYPDPDAPRFRHYHWRHPAFTFGYGQKLAEVRGGIPEAEAELCRRPTGGGVVDHRNDWTYALVVPRRHPLCSAPAAESYRVVHETIRAVLTSLGHHVVLYKPEKKTSTKRASPPGICFREPATFDVVEGGTGAKVAGAAQKRTNKGLLFQGSLDRASLSGCDWDGFFDLLARGLAEVFAAEPISAGWPDLDPEEESHLVEQFASEEWLQRR